MAGFILCVVLLLSPVWLTIGIVVAGYLCGAWEPRQNYGRYVEAESFREALSQLPCINDPCPTNAEYFIYQIKGTPLGGNLWGIDIQYAREADWCKYGDGI